LSTEQTKLIVPLDFSEMSAAETVIQSLSPEVNFWKIGLELFIHSGPAGVAQVKKQGGRVFLDLKLHDIPNTVAKACLEVCTLGVDLLTIHSSGGQAMMQAAASAVQSFSENTGKPGPKLLAVSLLTSIDQSALSSELNVYLDVPDYVVQMAVLARRSGVAGIVCSPQEIELVRQACGPDFLIVTPGIRPSGSNADDQRRTLTPSEAIEQGADYLVIGRPITQHPQPRQMALKILAEIAGAEISGKGHASS
jgi:orotidine-5'-phosphate decarboxylase